MTTGQIHEIAEELDLGFRAFVHQTTGQLLFFPDDKNNPGIEMDAWSEELEELKKNASDYFEVEKWTSGESFEMMRAFAEQMADPNLQSRLLNALSGNKPFRAFKSLIDNTGDPREQWFDFKGNWQRAFVEEKLKRLSENAENGG